MGTDHADTDPGYDGYICGNDVRIPLGIWAAMSDRIYRIIMPILDFMQTMPAFVYLIPAIPFFGLGPVSGIFATVIFSMPPAIRLTTLGIRQVPAELTEAADAFGSTPRQKLLKVQLPLATPTIMTGINQTIMLALSMVVIAAMIGAGGLGAEVWKAIQRLEPGAGFEAGIAVVILAMILDRITQNIGQRRKIEKKGITQC
jgi:glycine betaine/proline transport system permease protein